MNSIEILYQIYRARYSLTQVQAALDKGMRLAVIGSEAQLNAITGWLGERREGVSAECLPLFKLPLQPEDSEKLKDCDGAVVHIGTELPDGDYLREQARLIPLNVRCIWFVESTSVNKFDSLQSDGATPRLYRLDPLDPWPLFIRHLLRFFPSLAIHLARDYAQVRFYYSRALTRRAASRASMLAAASTIPAPPIPIIQQAWGFFATTGETMAITAGQLRLCLLVAALHGRPVDFFDRVGELWPIIGSAFGWRALARELIGLIPVAGWAFKSSLAYSGTWLVGEGSRLYYEHGQPSEGEQLREFKRLAKLAARESLKEAILDDSEEVPDPPQAESAAGTP